MSRLTQESDLQHLRLFVTANRLILLLFLVKHPFLHAILRSEYIDQLNCDAAVCVCVCGIVHTVFHLRNVILKQSFAIYPEVVLQLLRCITKYLTDGASANAVDCEASFS